MERRIYNRKISSELFEDAYEGLKKWHKKG